MLVMPLTSVLFMAHDRYRVLVLILVMPLVV